MTTAKRVKEILKYWSWGMVGALWIYCSEVLARIGEPHMFIGMVGGAACGISLGALLCMLRDSSEGKTG